jgi:hypothetical protein
VTWRCLWLIFAVTGLLWASVMDADGDPTTTNLPSVVLIAKAADRAQDDASMAAPGPLAGVRPTSFALLCRRIGRSLGVVGYRSHSRVRPIRGP